LTFQFLRIYIRSYERAASSEFLPIRGRPLKIGVKIGPASERTLKRVAESAERAGFDSVWLSERVAIPLDKSHPYQPLVDPWIGLAFVAAVTERVTLGTSVSQIALRPPVLMARELATLDRLSEGRLIVGAGAGWVEEEFTSTAVPFETRGGRLNEFIRLLRHLWTAPEEPWLGKFFSIPAVGLIKPVTPGGPPIYVGAASSAGLRRAARYSDGFIATALRLSTLAGIKKRLEEMRARFGRDGAFPFLAQVTPPATAEDAKTMVKDHATAGVDGLILTYGGELPDAFLKGRDVVKALIES
jgi:probable F420-dependent oxidoreductase